MSQCCQNPAIRIAKIRENLDEDAREAFASMLKKEDMVNVLDNISISPNNSSQNRTGNNRSGSGNSFDIPMPSGERSQILPDNVEGEGRINLNPQSPEELLSNPDIIENSPDFRVPANPLVPSEYREVLTYNDIQFLNGFIRTQIGRYIRVECLIGSNEVVVKTGYLIGVGLNYILLQESITGNVLSVDFWSIKFIYMYYDEKEAERALPFGPLLNAPLGRL